ncbi:MAG: VIT and VWA domain-containing protein [Bacteroidales bacterium]|nr:VIT and VWA domain-containing protein [Lachnoclostridium sp.]MCM1385474.1 VIT and VWA domain-containing protein [Lachnoclostridium sp.]MCM1466240.1 VIT and VWA domain-containing protein [Bacteroidales bacterium]
MKIYHTTQTFRLRAFLTLLIWMAVAAYSPTVYAKENKEEEAKTQAPYFIILNEESPDSPVDRFPLKSTDVTTNISGIIAETYVRQTYVNEGSTPINARYVFPVSTDVTVHGMKMEIGGQIVTAQIKEKEEAKKEYEEAKSEGKSASLLQQKRPNVFTMDVANIMPGETASIELHYTEMITPVEGTYEFVFPTVVGPRFIAPDASEKENGDNTKTDTANAETDWAVIPYLSEGETPSSEYHITVNLATGVPIGELSCKSHEIQVEKENDSTARITLQNPEDYAGNRDFILKYKLTGEEIKSGLVFTEGESENYFMLTLQPPERYTLETIPPREYIFVLDVSGSMNGYPLDTAKELIQNLVSGLRESDTFNLILFSGDSAQLSPTSLPATKQNIKKAAKMISAGYGSGGTSLAPALENALAIPADENVARSIVIITDGYISNEQSIFDLINENMGSASFFSFGIGKAVNSYLIEGIATAGFGESFLVTDSADAEDCAERFRTYIQSPLLTNISVTYDGFDVYDVEPAVPATLFAQKPIVLFGKWKGNPEGTIRITGKTGNQDYSEEISVADVAVTKDSDALRYLWARKRLERLTDYGSIRNDSSIKEEVTNLGLTYNLATPYTSFIAVIDTVKNPEGESTDVDQASPLPLKVSNLALGGGYMTYSEPETVFMVFAMSGVLAIHMLRLYRKKKQTQSA